MSNLIIESSHLLMSSRLQNHSIICTYSIGKIIHFIAWISKLLQDRQSLFVLNPDESIKH